MMEVEGCAFQLRANIQFFQIITAVNSTEEHAHLTDCSPYPRNHPIGTTQQNFVLLV